MCSQFFFEEKGGIAMTATNNNSTTGRLHELQNQFQSVGMQIQDGPVKTALSLLHGMIQESWRNVDHVPPHEDARAGIQDIANLYQQAPKMEGPAVNEPLPVGTPAPDFSLPDASGQPVSLKDYRGQTVLLVFYPLDWSPGCSRQLDLYQQELAEFRKRGIQLIGISVDSIYSHGAWAAVRGLTFPLLADFNPKGDVAKKYRVYRPEDGFSERALYLIDGDGLIQYSHISPYVHHVPDIYELYSKIDEVGALRSEAVQ